MWKNYLLIAYRNLRHRKFYSIINIFGLSVGLTCSFLIFLFIQSELSYEKKIPDYQNIYRLGCNNNIGGKLDTYSNAPRPVSSNLAEQYPEILAATKVCGVNGLLSSGAMVGLPEGEPRQRRVFAVDSTFFDVFEYEFIRGSKEGIFSNPFGVVITQSMANELFPNEDAFGKQIKVEDQSEITVAAIIADPEGLSHFQFDMLTTWLAAYREGEENAWYGWHVYHYLRLQDGIDIKALELKFKDFYQEKMKPTFDRMNGLSSLFLQPIKDIHLYSHNVWEMGQNSDITIVYVFTIIALFLLIIACINYMNLATAQSARRSREVGLRKVCGSLRETLIRQFMIESILLALIGALLALVFVELLIPFFNNVTGLSLEFNIIHNPLYLLYMISLAFFVGIIAGVYPAFVLSSFKPIDTLKGKYSKSSRGFNLRKLLIVIQFTISIALIIGTFTVIRQLNYARTIDPGFERANVMVLQTRADIYLQHLQEIKNEFPNQPGIISTSATLSPLGGTLNRFPANLENNEGAFEQISMQFMQVDYDYVDFMKMKITEGRNFEREKDPEWFQSMLVNQKAVERLGWVDPIGKRFLNGTDENGNAVYINVAGIVEDFMPGSLHQEIRPILMFLVNDSLQTRYRTNRNISVMFRLDEKDFNRGVSYIEDKFQEYDSSSVPNYYFMDDQFNFQYRNEQRILRIFSYFTIITIVIACLGLFGLASYTAQQRTKEIGIRKVMGATALQITYRLTKEFTIWVMVSNLIAWPISIILMRKWLQNFAYHVQVGIGSLLAASALALIISLLTVSMRTYNAAQSNPVEAIKYE